jgi:hypothetical protein
MMLVFRDGVKLCSLDRNMEEDRVQYPKHRVQLTSVTMHNVHNCYLCNNKSNERMLSISLLHR